MTSFADKLNNKSDESTTITYKCDKCGECKRSFFIHLDQGKGDKYICSYLCSKEMHIDYGKDHWNDVINLSDFQHPTPPIYGKKYKHQFGVRVDMINTDRNIHIQEMYEEDKRIEILEQEIIDSTSDSDYYSD